MIDTPLPRALPALLAIGLSATLALSPAGAQAPSPSAPGTASAPAPAEEKPLDFEPFPEAEDKPKAPKAAEWQAATPVKLTRKGPRAKSCRMYRVREWLKVRCETRTTAVGFLGGTAAGAFFWLPQAREGEPAPPHAEVIFPVKQGDRRVLELFSFGPAYGGSMIPPGLVLQEHWVAGEPAPVVVIH